MKFKSIILILIGIILLGVVIAVNYVQKKDKINDFFDKNRNKSIHIPDINLTNLDGSIIKLEALVDNKRTSLVMLFNPYCDDCVEKLENIKKHEEEFANNPMLFIGGVDKTDTITRLINRIDFTTFKSIKTVLSDPRHGSVADSLKLNTIPGLFINYPGIGLIQIDDDIRMKKLFELLN